MSLLSNNLLKYLTDTNMDKPPSGVSVLSPQHSVSQSVIQLSLFQLVLPQKSSDSLSDDTPQKLLGHNYLNVPRGS